MGEFSYENLMQYYWLFTLNDSVLEQKKAHEACELAVGGTITAIRFLAEEDQRRLYRWFQVLYGEIDG